MFHSISVLPRESFSPDPVHLIPSTNVYSKARVNVRNILQEMIEPFIESRLHLLHLSIKLWLCVRR